MQARSLHGSARPVARQPCGVLVSRNGAPIGARPVSKLAQRLADARRSGIYRVEDTEAVEEAAALNGFALERVALDARAPALGERAARAGDGLVMVVAGAQSLGPGALEALLAPLEAALAAHRAAGRRVFAAFLDPACALPLAPLHNRRQHSLIERD